MFKDVLVCLDCCVAMMLGFVSDFSESYADRSQSAFQGSMSRVREKLISKFL